MRHPNLTALLRHLVPNAGTIAVVALLAYYYPGWAMPGAAPTQQSSTSPVISYQGHLTDSEGKAMNGLAKLSFELYSSETGGTADWSETHADVLVSNGEFHVQLGAFTPLTDLKMSGALYLQVAVNDKTLAPRERLSSVPSALSLVPSALTVFEHQFNPSATCEDVSCDDYFASTNNTFCALSWQTHTSCRVFNSGGGWILRLAASVPAAERPYGCAATCVSW